MEREFSLGPYSRTVYLVYKTKGQKVRSIRLRTPESITLADLQDENSCVCKLAKGWRVQVSYGREGDSPEQLHVDFDTSSLGGITPIQMQLCLCGDVTKQCAVGADPDCNDPNVCTPYGEDSSTPSP